MTDQQTAGAPSATATGAAPAAPSAPAATSAPSAPPAVSSRAVLGLCCGSTFVAFLDLSVVNIAFPDILKDFPGTSIGTVTWVVSAYAVLFAALLTPLGRVADVRGRRPVFLAALTGFTLASALCGAAPSIGWLIGARFVQGAMAAGMIPAALGLILATTPREQIAKSVAAWSAAAGFSAVVGPAVGGVLLEVFDWRAVFFINIPFGIVLLLAGLSVLPKHLTGNGQRLPDPIGTLTLALGVAGAVTGLTEGDRWGWGSARTVGVLVAAVVLLALTVLVSAKRSAPAVDLAVWRNGRYSLANAGLGLLSLAMFTWMLGAPLFTAGIWGWSTMQTAGALTIGAVLSMVGSLVAGRITTPATHVRAAVLGCLLFAGSNVIWASSLFGGQSDFWGGWVPSAVLGGLGLGFGLTSMSSLAAATIHPLKFAVGIGMTLTVRQLGGAIGSAALAAIVASSAVPGSVASFHGAYRFAAVISVVAAVVAAAIAFTLRPRPVD